MAKKIVVEAVLEKETKNTIRYREIESDEPVKVGTIYLQKWIAKKLNGGEFPERIKVSVEVAE